MFNTNKNTQNSDNELFLFEPKTLFVIIVVSVLTLLIAFFGEQGARFLTSVLSPIPAHAPYDGMTNPVKQVPNWVKLTEAERKLPFNLIPDEKKIPIPTYNATRLAIPLAGLKWNDAHDDAIRNEKITYSVPYLGSYKLDGLEGSGSHPAVDIKIPESTPLYAIGNGTVVKADTGNGGFGHHVVLQHNNFPSLEDPANLVTLYSSYSHMSALSVKANDVVTKGQLLGFSGSTGTATTPHIHFQIDTDTPPWHPYWPFNSADMSAAGLSFFEAINKGLKQENAVANTINPMKYVQKYFDNSSVVVSAKPEITTTIAEVEKANNYDAMTFVVQPSGGSSFKLNTPIKMVIQAFDANGTLIQNPDFKEEVSLSLLNSIGTLNRSTLTANDFAAGITSVVELAALKTGKEKVIVRFKGREFSSSEFEVVEEAVAVKQEPLGGFSVETERNFTVVGGTLKIIVKAKDTNAVDTTSVSFKETPTMTLSNQIGTFSPSSLAPNNFINGVAEIIFTGTAIGSTQFSILYNGLSFQTAEFSVLANTTENTALIPVPPAPPAPVTPEPVKDTGTLYESTGTTAPTTGPFTDIDADSPYAEALIYLKQNGLVSGYADGSFKTSNKVSRAEAITFILRVIKQNVRDTVNTVFPDVSKEAWYVKFVGTAYELGFVKGYPDGTFKPNATVTLAEFFTMLFVAAKTDIDPKILTALPEGVAAGEWFAPYIQEAIKKNIIEVIDNKLEPSKPLTRGEIANILYRLKKIEKK